MGFIFVISESVSPRRSSPACNRSCSLVEGSGFRVRALAMREMCIQGLGSRIRGSRSVHLGSRNVHSRFGIQNLIKGLGCGVHG